MIQAIHHVQITVPAARLEEALHFYRDVLGLAVSPNRPENWERKGCWFIVDDRELHIGIEDTVDRKHTRAHIAYKVDDAHLWRTRLSALGLEILDQPELPGYTRFHVRDPFDNMIEFIQPLRIITPIDRNPQPRVHLSVALIHHEQLLLVREGKPGMRDKWNLPGGHAEKNEFAIDGALRELLEETGVQARPTGVLGVFSTPYSIRLIITAQAVDPRPIAGDEILESRFWSISNAKQLDDSHWINPQMIRQILARIERNVQFPLDVISAVGF